VHQVEDQTKVKAW